MEILAESEQLKTTPKNIRYTFSDTKRATERAS